MDKKKIQGLVATGIVSAGMLNQVPMTALAATRREISNQVKATQTIQDNKKIVVEIPDLNLRRVLNTKYLHQDADAQITRYQLRSLTGTLYLGNSDIKDLTGIEECKGITGLYLSYNNEITDLTPIKQLDKLTRLNITDQTITVDKDKFSKDMIKDIDGKTVTLTQTGENTYTFKKMVKYGNKGYTTNFEGKITVKGNTSTTSTTKPTKPVKPVEPSKPTTKPTTPVKPVEPSKPTTKPTTPVKPVEPSKPITKPTTPVKPVEPTTPITKPTTPVKPVEPTTPTTKPTTPVKPVEPTTPTTKPTTQVKPVEPSKPITKPTTPVKPVQPIKPNITDDNKVIVNIPDDNLRKVLNIQLGQKEDAQITRGQLRSLKGTLYIGYSDIQDLTGIEECKGINGLFLTGNKIKDLRPLKTLTQLTYLDVIEQNIIVDKFSEDMVKDVNGKTVQLDKISDDTYAFFTEITYGDGSYTGQFSGQIIVKDNTSTKPTEPTKPTIPVTPVEPIEPIEPTTPVTPVEPIEPIEPTTPVTPVEPIEPIEPTQPTTPVTPVEPTKPTEPTTPVTPVEPTQPTTPGDNKEIVNIPDYNLRKALNTQLGQEEGAQITRDQLRSLTGTLYLGYSDIQDLTGIEECTGIDGLLLTGNKIKDLTPLKTLTKLTYLEVIEQNIIVDKFSENMVKDVNGKTVQLDKMSDDTYSFFTEITYGDGSYTGQFSGQIIIQQ